LENIPKQNRDNWIHEIKLLNQKLPKNAKVLQIGSMDGTRIINILKARPDLQLTGLEIDSELVEIANKKVPEVNFIHGDITNPPSLEKFDYVICLNNTLG